MDNGNLFAALTASESEQFATLAEEKGCRIERIVSHGQASPEGFWYEQRWNEWVVVLKRHAGLRLEEEPAARVLGEGDWIVLPAGCRHRVEWTEQNGVTVWLAVHYGGDG